MGEFGISFLPQTFFSWRPGVRTITTGPLPEGRRGGRLADVADRVVTEVAG